MNYSNISTFRLLHYINIYINISVENKQNR